MSTLIETKRCSLDTLSVTIQALHVEGKQMTLAVFRQLPIGTINLADYFSEIKKVETWGIVNYSIKYEGNLWLVFSLNGILLRRLFCTNAHRGADSWYRQYQEGKRKSLSDMENLEKNIKEREGWIQEEKNKGKEPSDWSLRYLKDRINDHKKLFDTLPNIQKKIDEAKIELDYYLKVSSAETKLSQSLPQLFIAV